MSYAILISGSINATDTKQLILASHNNSLRTYMRVTNGGRGESNSWSERDIHEYSTVGTIAYSLIGEVLATPLTAVDIEAINNNEMPNVLIQKLTKQYRLRHTNIDSTKTMQDIVDEALSLIEQDPALLSKYRSDGRSDKQATTTTTTRKPEVQKMSASPIVINQVVRNSEEQSTLAYIPSLTSESVRTYVPRKFANGLTEEQIYHYALKAQKNVSISGPAGTGKTTSFMTFASKNGLEFGSMSCNPGCTGAM